MLDYRIYTFLSLCETLSYTKTAAQRQMTQPGVTQHIKLLEKEYGAQLFSYKNRTLTQTEAGRLLEAHLRAAVSAQQEQKLKLSAPKQLPLRLGATKTIGDYVMAPAVAALVADSRYRLSLEIENTNELLKKLDEFAIDLALIEGFFDKEKYASRLLRREPFVGICAPDHPFAGKNVALDKIFSQHLLLREEGSGTRAVFERLLSAHNYTVSAFEKESVISSFSLLTALVAQTGGISFVYKAVAQANPSLATFKIKNEALFGEFHYVYLPSYESEPPALSAVAAAMADTEKNRP